MPQPIDTAQLSNVVDKNDLLYFKMNPTSQPSLQPIQQNIIPNYDANKASEYVTDPSFNTLNPRRGYLEMENQMSQGQSSTEQWMHGVGKAVANIPLKFMEGMGYAYGLGKWGIANGFDVQHVDDMINNDFAKYFHDASKSLDTSLPIYGSFDYNEGNILQKMGTAKFWASDFTDGLAFLASAYGGSFIGKGIGKGLGAAGEGLGMSAEAAASLNKWSSFASGTIYNTVSESGFEAKDSYDSVYNDLVGKGLDPKTAKEKASQAAANTFTSNLAILTLSNAFEMKAFMGNPIDESNRLFRQIARRELSAAEISPMKQALKGAALGAISEGLYEEGMQNAIQQFQKKKAEGIENGEGFTGGYFNEWLKGFSNTEGQASMILGALIGAPFQAHSHYSEAKEKINTINFLTGEVEKQREYLKASDKIYQGFLENRYKKDNDGKIIYNDNNEPVLNEEWFKNKAFQIQLDEDYRNEKISALLKGDLSHASIVDQYYTSRKLWDYLANPLYENSDEAFKAFKDQLNTQAQEYKNISDQINQDPNSTEKDQAIANQRFAKDIQMAIANAETLKSEFDNIQKNISLDPSNPNSSFIYEKISKALFHEATKRRALSKLIADSDTTGLSEAAVTKLTEMIQSSEELTKKLSNKEDRQKYIDEVKTEEEIINSKVDEFRSILDKYKEEVETQKQKTKVESLKDKGKGLLRPIISKFQRQQAEQQVEEKPVEKKKSLEETISKEDKDRLKVLQYEISKYSYQNGKNYLSRINEAYGNEVAVGKKYQYYRELGEETIRKSKIKDSIEASMNDLSLVNSSPITPESYQRVHQALLEIFNGIQQLTKSINDDGSQTNYTSADLKYVEDLQDKLKTLLDSIEQNIKDSLKSLKDQASQFNQYKQKMNDAIDQSINIVNNLYDGDIYLDFDDVNTSIYHIFGPDLLYLSFMNNYFVDNYNTEAVVITQGFERGDITRDEALTALSDIIEENSLNIGVDYHNIKAEAIGQIIASLPQVDLDKLLDISSDINQLENIEEDFKSKDEVNSKLEEMKNFSKKNVNKNKFLQIWKKDLENQDEFFESLFVEENPEFSFQVSKQIVDKYKKDFKDKNQTELDKIEDVFYYQNRLEELKDVEKILRPRSTEFKNRELHNTYGELLSLIHNLQNFIIPLAIKNQNNRKVIQQISSNIRDKSYFNQLGLNVEIDLEGNLQLKETTQKLIEEINKLYGEDIRKSKFPEKFSFLVIEKVIRDLRDKTEEELKPLHELIDTLKKEVSSEIQNFQNARGEARFKSNTIFDNYLVNPDTIFEQLVYTMSSFNDKALRTYSEKENWFSSPLYNYSKHLSPALLLDELKKKKFSGSLNMPYDKLVDYVELHLEYSALNNLENNLKSKLDFTPYYNNLKQLVNSYEFAPTYQQEIALREAYQWWNDKDMILSYLKGVAGTGKTSVFLKYFLSLNNISLDNVILSAHNESAVNTLKGISTSSNGMMISEMLAKPNDFFKNTNLIVIDEINANSDKTITDILDKLTVVNRERAKDNQLKILFMGDPTQLRVSNRQFIDSFYTHGNSYGIKYGNSLKTYSPLTVAYRSDVGSINNLANQFRDTNQVIKNVDLQSSSTISDKESKGAILSTNERTNGTLDDIFKRLEAVKEENTTKAIIVSNHDEVSKYSDEVTKRKIDNVEILTIENAQGRTFDEVYIDIVKPTLLDTGLANNHKDDSEYFFNTVMYTAISRARNLVVLSDNSDSFTHSVKDDVSDVNKDLAKEKKDLKNKINEYIDYASIFYQVEKEKPTKSTEEEKNKEENEEIEIEEQENFENDVPGTEVDITDEPESVTFIDAVNSTPQTQIHEIQNPEVNVLEEKEILGKKNGPSARLGNEVIYMKSADGNIYAYVEDSNSPEYYRYLTTIYPENLRNDVPTEKHLKTQYYNNTVSNLISYNKNSLNKNSVNRTHQIASGKIDYTQNLQFLYEKYDNKESIEREIESKGGLYNYINEKLLPLISKKDSDEKYGEITDYRVFVATEQDKNQELISGITNIEFGHPYLKFKVEKTNRKGEKRIQEFFIKLEAPVLKNTDSIAAPLITFYNSINNIEQMFESINLPELKLGNNDFAKLILKFKNDFTAQVEEKLNFKNQKYDHYTIVPKEQLFVTKDDVYDVLKDYNLSDDNLSLVLATLQKESRELIPLLYSTKKDKVKVSSYGYINFLKEQVALGNVDELDTKNFNNTVSQISGDGPGKQMNEIILNKTYANSLNVIKSFRAFGYDLNAMEENVTSTVREIRRTLTQNSFVPITNGQYKGKFFAFDPLIGQVVVIDSIPDKRFVSQSYTKQQGIGMIDLEDTKLVKKNSTVQNSFNILARSNGVLNKDTDKQINIRLSYTINKSGNDVSVLFAPTLLKENKYENSFDSKYYNLLRQAFDNYVQEERRQGNKFVFDLTYQDDNGNNVDFQYKDQKNKEGKSIWKNQNIIGGFRKEASLQNENALQVMKDFLVEKGAKLLDGTTITQAV